MEPSGYWIDHLLNSGEDNPALFLNLEVQPSSFAHVIPHGSWELVLSISAANRAPRFRRLRVKIAGKWYNSEKDMCEKGISFEVS